MNNSISFTGRSNNFFAITRKGWNNDIPERAYNQININRKAFEKFARKHNIKITLTDARNMLPELHTGSESAFLSGKMAIKVEKRPSLIQNFRNSFSNLKQKFTKPKPKPKSKLEMTVVPYFDKDNKKIPTLKETKRIGFFCRL